MRVRRKEVPTKWHERTKERHLEACQKLKRHMCGKQYEQRQSMYYHFRETKHGDDHPVKSASRGRFHCKPCGQYSASSRQAAFSRSTAGKTELRAADTEMRRRRRDAPRRWRERAKIGDMPKYLKLKRDERALHLLRHPDAQRKANKRVRERALAKSRHRCDDCNHDFPTKAALKKHRGGPKHAETVQKKRLGVDKLPTKCTVCGKTYAQRQSLYKHHRNSGHGDGNPLKSGSRGAFHCEDCGQYFRFKSTSSVLPVKSNVRTLEDQQDHSVQAMMASRPEGLRALDADPDRLQEGGERGRGFEMYPSI
ncbi:hypothetical protein MRS44_002401 [Fusarium solani]|uniref:C2H2-type domain-containing protein n=1 Tax=Fusarium solani TaxID=169388 RepID=A0A9P9GPL9_FUSSL|nr:uncharacterized protein B0J15DRAFT_470234 [Fusarium solani]KAH7243190.1 hypothetical protein B0J15DRAFT_470234 [Fusarium solani]KAJ3468336.1 hypothetical protein MRS44_002401 [Fusarium solani]